MALGGDTDKSSDLQINHLVLSVDENGKILFLNKEFEKIAGYSRNQAINKNITDLLVKDETIEQWEKLFNSTKKDQLLKNFELPLITKNGKEIMTSWAMAPINEVDDRIGSIGLVGEIKQSYTTTFEKDFQQETKKIKQPVLENINQDKKEDIILFRFQGKKIVFRKRPQKNKKEEKKEYQKKPETPNFDDPIYKTDKIHIRTKNKKTEEKEPENVKDDISEKVDTILKNQNQEEQDNTKKETNDLNEQYKKIEEENTKLREENKKLKDSIKNIETNLSDTKDKITQLKDTDDENNTEMMNLIKNSIYFIFDAIGGKKKKEEFEKIITKLEDRKKMLSELESKLNEDKKLLNKNRDEFINWRRKLETLEEKINEHEQEIKQKEEKVKKNLSFFAEEEIKEKINAKQVQTQESTQETEKYDTDHHELLDKIPHSAAIIQRGILKQVNDSFVELLGYDVNKLLEKNLFDFVVSEGFLGIEKYYLKRLKGENINSYETTFHTSKDENIAVEVNTKPVNFQGEKAEIAVFRKLDENQQETSLNEIININQEEDLQEKDTEEKDNEDQTNSDEVKKNTDLNEEKNDENSDKKETKLEKNEESKETIDEKSENNEKENKHKTEDESEKKTDEKKDTKKEESGPEDKLNYDIIKKIKNDEL